MTTTLTTVSRRGHHHKNEHRSRSSAMLLLVVLVVVVIGTTTTTTNAFTSSSPVLVSSRRQQREGQQIVVGFFHNNAVAGSGNLRLEKNEHGGFPFCASGGGGRRTFALSSSKKGFGGSSEQPTKKKKRTVSQPQQQKVALMPGEEEVVPVAAAASKQKQQEMNAGQKALAKMRRQRAEEKDAELRRIKELKDLDKQVQESAPAIPEKVASRMGKRMLPFVGIPLFLSTGSFVAFWYFATYKNVEFQPGMVAAVSAALLIFGLLGITYSVMSASWDPDREGDLVGTDEFKRNLENVKEGLSRSRENAVLREKMSGLDDTEIDAALRDLQRRENVESKRGQTLQDKFKDELD